MPTLFALIERINGIGSRRWSVTTGIGRLKASRLVEWLQAYEADIGMAIGAHVAKPQIQLEAAELAAVIGSLTALLRLEKFLVPSDLDGSQRQYRAEKHKCMLAARNDHEAIHEWPGSEQLTPAVLLSSRVLTSINTLSGVRQKSREPRGLLKTTVSMKTPAA